MLFKLLNFYLVNWDLTTAIYQTTNGMSIQSTNSRSLYFEWILLCEEDVLWHETFCPSQLRYLLQNHEAFCQ